MCNPNVMPIHLTVKHLTPNHRHAANSERNASLSPWINILFVWIEDQEKSALREVGVSKDKSVLNHNSDLGFECASLCASPLTLMPRYLYSQLDEVEMEGITRVV